MNSYTHPTAIIEEQVTLDEGVKVWHFCHIRKHAHLKENVSLGRDVFVDESVVIEDGARIQNGVSVYQGICIGRNCFVGPHVIFTNDLYPRVGNKAWKILKTILEPSCSIGAGSIIRCGVTIGSFAMVGAGSIVTKDIRPFHLALGTPARETKKICACGQTALPLDTINEKLVSDCCYENLNPIILNEAKIFIASLN